MTNISTTRIGGGSVGRFASLNLGLRVGDDPVSVHHNRALLTPITGASPTALTLAGQVHGANVAVVTEDFVVRGAAAIPDTDAMITNIPDVPLVILVADCVVVSIYDPVHEAVGLAHAGWKGTVAGIAVKTVAKMAEVYGSTPADLIAGIGPSIGPCCYEVGREVIDQFVAADTALADRVLHDRADGVIKHLDLWLANRLGLEAAGLEKDNVGVAGFCTACDTEKFYSHRAEDGWTGRFAGLIMIHGKTKRVY